MMPYEKGDSEEINSALSSYESIAENQKNAGLLTSEQELKEKEKLKKWKGRFDTENILNLSNKIEFMEGSDKAAETLSKYVKTKDFSDKTKKFQNRVFKEIRRLEKRASSLKNSSGKVSEATKESEKEYNSLRKTSLTTGQTSNETVKEAREVYYRRLEEQKKAAPGPKKKSFEKKQIKLLNQAVIDSAIEANPNALRKENQEIFLKKATDMSNKLYGKKIDFIKDGKVTEEGRELLIERNAITSDFNGFATNKDSMDFIKMRENAYGDKGVYKELDTSIIKKVNEFGESLGPKTKGHFKKYIGPVLSKTLSKMEKLRAFSGGVKGITTKEIRSDLNQIATNMFFSRGDVQGISQYAQFLTSLGIDVGDVFSVDSDQLAIGNVKKSLSILSDNGFGRAGVYGLLFLGAVKDPTQQKEANKRYNGAYKKVATWYEDYKDNLEHLGNRDEVVNSIAMTVTGALMSEGNGALLNTPRTSLTQILASSEKASEVVEELKTKHPSLSSKFSLDGRDPSTSSVFVDTDNLKFENTLNSILNIGSGFQHKGKTIYVKSKDSMGFILALLKDNVKRGGGSPILAPGVLQRNIRFKGVSEGYKIQYKDETGSWNYLTVKNGEDYVITKNQVRDFNRRDVFGELTKTASKPVYGKYSIIEKDIYDFQAKNPLFNIFKGNLTDEQFKNLKLDRLKTSNRILLNRLF